MCIRDSAKTLYEKIWDRHVVASPPGEPTLLYVDLHLVHEVTSPQAFEGLRLNHRTVRRPDLTLATADHNVPTDPIATPVKDPVSRRQLEALDENCKEFAITLFPRGHENQGIVHVIGPELGVSQPGMTIVCGDSHTSTHGAFGALAFGIGTSEVEHVLATQTLPQQRAKTMSVTVDGEIPSGVSAKDIVLAIVAKLGTGGGAARVPGSHRVKKQAEEEGLDTIFRDAGFEWREPGCSMCLGMNPDQLLPNQRSASTSNRNFEGRQGRGGRTHLVSPVVAAATAILGRFASPDEVSA